MASDPDNAHEWFTAGEAVALARLYHVEGVPLTARCMVRRLAIEAAPHQRRSRKGRLQEWHYSAFPEWLREEMRIEVLERQEAAKTAMILTGGDIRIMETALDLDIRERVRFGSLVKRRVRRSSVTIDGWKYWADIQHLEGQDVLVTLPHMLEPKPAFLWRYDPVKNGLAAHGEDGFICMTAAP